MGLVRLACAHADLHAHEQDDGDDDDDDDDADGLETPRTARSLSQVGHGAPVGCIASTPACAVRHSFDNVTDLYLVTLSPPCSPPQRLRSDLVGLARTITGRVRPNKIQPMQVWHPPPASSGLLLACPQPAKRIPKDNRFPVTRPTRSPHAFYPQAGTRAAPSAPDVAHGHPSARRRPAPGRSLAL
jgi:hypothetical protein